MIQDEQELYVDSPWDCEGLDPFRDDPVETDNVSYKQHNIEDSVCEEDPDNNQNHPCSCGKCVEMPSTEEQLCCKALVGWQREYKSKGAKRSQC